MWQWWSARNKTNEGKIMATTSEICSSVAYHLMELEKLQNLVPSTKPKQTLKWKPPPCEFYKINIDASFHLSTGVGGWRMIMRNAKGEVLEVGVGHLQHLSSPLHAEASAALQCLERAAHWRMPCVILETDSTTLSDALM